MASRIFPSEKGAVVVVRSSSVLTVYRDEASEARIAIKIRRLKLTDLCFTLDAGLLRKDLCGCVKKKMYEDDNTYFSQELKCH